jgi:signal peptidase I
MKIAASSLRIFVAPLLGGLVLALFVRFTMFQLFTIPSESMSPTLRSGDCILVIPYESWLAPRAPEIGDVVVFESGEGRHAVKRIVAAGGDSVTAREGRLSRNSQPVAEDYLPTPERTADFDALVPAGEFFVLGDNRDDSVDSRFIGPVRRERIVGQARFIVWSSTAPTGRPTASATTTAPSAPSRGRARILVPIR